jgi:hypothetical protein
VIHVHDIIVLVSLWIQSRKGGIVISTFIMRNLWMAVAAAGIAFVAAGLFMVSEGLEAKELVRDRLVAEQITTSGSAAIPNTAVQDVATAKAQEAVITEHTLGEYGPYSAMERGDPNRATYVTGVSLRTALNLAVMGFRVSDLVIGMGAFVVAVGLGNVFFVSPLAFAVGRAASGRGGENLTSSERPDDAWQTPAAA